MRGDRHLAWHPGTLACLACLAAPSTPAYLVAGPATLACLGRAVNHFVVHPPLPSNLSPTFLPPLHDNANKLGCQPRISNPRCMDKERCGRSSGNASVLCVLRTCSRASLARGVSCCATAGEMRRIAFFDGKLCCLQLLLLGQPVFLLFIFSPFSNNRQVETVFL